MSKDARAIKFSVDISQARAGTVVSTVRARQKITKKRNLQISK